MVTYAENQYNFYQSRTIVPSHSLFILKLHSDFHENFCTYLFLVQGILVKRQVLTNYFTIYART